MLIFMPMFMAFFVCVLDQHGSKTSSHCDRNQGIRTREDRQITDNFYQRSTKKILEDPRRSLIVFHQHKIIIFFS